MSRRPVFNNVMIALERRVVQGDYILKDLPGERRLAQELGVSYLTARKAVTKLIEKKVLSRRTNGGLIVHPQFDSATWQPKIALLTPAYPSAHFIHCRSLVSEAAKRRGLKLRPVEYFHWHDPVVLEVMQNSDGLVVIPNTEPIPLAVTKAFTSALHKVIVLDDDMSELGIPSIRLFAHDHILLVLEHLWTLGHRRIDCLNTQGTNNEIERRIGHWRTWLASRGGSGELWNAPVAAFSDPTERAYDTMRKILQVESRSLSAVVCTTQPAAIGAIRACHETGLQVGKAISICTMNNEPTGRFFCPSLTGLEMPDIDLLLNRCFDWFSRPAQGWQGDKRMVPAQPRLLEGESTGASVAMSVSPANAPQDFA